MTYTEMFKNLHTIWADMCEGCERKTDDCINECEKADSLIAAFRALDRFTPEKPIIEFKKDGIIGWTCPECRKYHTSYINAESPRFCNRCGQAIELDNEG